MHGVCACASASASASVWISTISHSSCATVRWPNRQYYYHLPLTHETKPNRLVKSEWFCFFNVSIPYLFYVCWIYLFIYIQCSSFSFSFSLERTMRVQNGSNLSIFFISFVWMCIPCLLYSHLLDLPYISFVHSFKFCNNFMWTYHSFLYDGLCMSVHVHIRSQGMSNEHWALA